MENYVQVVQLWVFPPLSLCFPILPKVVIKLSQFKGWSQKFLTRLRLLPPLSYNEGSIRIGVGMCLPSVWGGVFYSVCGSSQELLAAAKSLQSCPTLCIPIDGSSPGSSFPGILQARILEWVAISFSTRQELLGYQIFRLSPLVPQMVESTRNAEDWGSISRSLGEEDREGNDYPLQNSINREAWRATVHGVA